MWQQTVRLWYTLDRLFFPPSFEPQRQIRWHDYLLILTLTSGLFALIGLWVPADGFIGYDWVYFFSEGIREPFYPPWAYYTRWLTWPGLIGLSCAGLVLGLYQRRASVWVMGAAFLTCPMLWLLFLGQIDGLVLLGLTGLPWLLPLALLKPQVSSFALLARRNWAIAGLLWLLLSMVIWGSWPLQMLDRQTYWQEVYQGAPQPQNISLWPASLLLAPLLLWFSRGDVDMLLLSGSFITPHLIPYSQVVLLPALARVPVWLALLLVPVSWFSLSANWVGDWGWYLGHLFPTILWLALCRKRLKSRQMSPTVANYV